MTILRQSAMRELERLPEDKITFVLQIMRGINGLDEDERLAKKNAFKRLEYLRKKADINENDTNILLDYLLMREPFYDNASEIVRRCVDGIYRGCVAAHSISNMFFILRKTYNIKERREILLSICEIFDIIGIDKTKLIIGLENEDFSDFEDCLQMECARDYGAKYIVTRNIADYEKSEIKAISPSDFLKGELMH